MKKFLIIFISIVIFLYFALSTNIGLKLIIKLYTIATNKIIKIEKIENDFPKKITLYNINYENLLNVKHISISLNNNYKILTKPIKSIILKSLDVNHIKIDSILIHNNKTLTININNLNAPSPISLEVFIKCNFNLSHHNQYGTCISQHSYINNNPFDLMFDLKNKKLNISLKNNYIEINKKKYITWNIQLNNINQINKNFTGHIKGQGKLINKSTSGIYQLNILSKDFSINDSSINNKKNTIAIKAKSIHIAKEQLNKVHALLHYNEKIKINELKFYNNHLLWQLEKPSDITFSSLTQWHITNTCLKNKQSSICAKINNNNNITYDLAIKQYPVKNIILENINILKGVINGVISFKKFLKIKLNISNLDLKTSLHPEPIKNISGSIISSNNLYNIKLSSNFKNQNITFKAQLDEKLNGQAKLKVNNFTLFKEPYINLTGNADLLVNLDNTNKIKGDIYITNLYFNPNNIVTSLPLNTIIKGKNKKTQTTIPVEGIINLQTIKPIKTSIYGLNGQLSGKLKLYLNYNKPIITTGELKLLNPKHHILNKLNITTAKIFYNKSPLYSPYININITRKLAESWQNTDPFSIANVTVGVKVFGSLFSPTFIYYSNPTIMQKNQIIASLIAGYQTNTIMPYQAVLFSIGVSSSNPNSLLNISNTLNDESKIPLIDSIQFISNEDFNNPWNHTDNTDTSVLITKRLTPKIGINYLFSLLDDLYEISLNTKLKYNTYAQIYKQNIGEGINILKFWQ